jgi:hypothetical protein
MHYFSLGNRLYLKKLQKKATQTNDIDQILLNMYSYSVPDFLVFAACPAVSRAEKLKVVVGASSATPGMLLFLFQTVSKIKVEKTILCTTPLPLIRPKPCLGS